MMQSRIGRNVRRAAVAAAVACGFAALPAAMASADPGPGSLYFHYGDTTCVLNDGGGFICEFGGPYLPPYARQTVAGAQFPLPFAVQQVSYEGNPIFPAHPSFAPKSATVLPGGNPDISDVATGQGAWGPYVEFGGTRCEVSFRASFSCSSGDHGFSTWWNNLAIR